MSLEYNDIKIDGKIRISPSSFYGLFDNPAKWYRNNILKEKDSPNTKKLLGTLLHNRIERTFSGLPIDEDEERKYVGRYDDNVEVNSWEIFDEINPIWNVVSEHLLTAEKPVEVEQPLVYEPTINQDVFIGGTFDYRTNDTVGDYKTTSKSMKGIGTTHKLQLLLYAYMLRKNGIDIQNIEVTYIVKYKTKPSIVQVYREPIDEKDMQYVLTHVKNLGTKISMCKANPELVDLFFYNNPLAHF